MAEKRDGGSFPRQLIYEFIMDLQRQVVMVVVRGEDPKVCI